MSDHLPKGAEVVVIGAGAVGAACAYFLAREGFRVQVLEQGRVASGTSSAGEGNLLVSDKEAGHELDLALYSNSVWHDDLAEFGQLWEFESKGGFVVASSPEGADALRELGARQRRAGIETVDVDAADIRQYEPYIRSGLAAAAYYPQDAQVQPMLLTAHLLRLARGMGAVISTGIEVTGIEHHDLGGERRVKAVRTSRGTIACDHVVNAAGTWASEIAAMAGVDVPVLPRRGFVLVTEPLPPTINRKVYAGEYVASTQSSDESLQTSTVIEGTQAGTILIGSSRERVGFDRTVSLPVLREIAAKALALFPSLARVRIMRTYMGFRPYCPDHLPVIGHDSRLTGMWHATGHEGAGIGLSVGTAKLLTQAMAGKSPDLDLSPFAPARFSAGDHA
ncbi:FAD-binding oxidoreductase [Nocardia sp. NEAU-G5]|uniref:FAD-binding oxidoreductase n=1 Tax=Nocardia albiluteola TaxID=2842303 RepID=A0ABS6B061_9NOCA|nr:FAD-binding oxidoreductase [Nocardia albiluteola]MBU3063696.1 FAD-binding oxidoreductase [Nocardia albiluteola]